MSVIVWDFQRDFLVRLRGGDLENGSRLPSAANSSTKSIVAQSLYKISLEQLLK